jgi:hypothetical protein
VGCADCHAGVNNSTLSSDNILPKMENCYTCHDQNTTECTTCHYEGKEDIKFDNPKREINFNHKYHIENLKLDCVTCHTGLDKVDYASSVNLPSMETCYSCHNDVKATNNCAQCHTQIGLLRPTNHRSDWTYEHKRLVRSGEKNCVMCHSQNYCQECHEGANSIGIIKTTKDQNLPYTPSNEGKESQILKKAHRLDYRFTHALDAKGKERNCQSCHEVQTFCVSCHEREGNFGVPASHLEAGFSAGGKHKEHAKRDIEACMSCHDVEGNDPTCMKCHM